MRGNSLVVIISIVSFVAGASVERERGFYGAGNRADVAIASHKNLRAIAPGAAGAGRRVLVRGGTGGEAAGARWRGDLDDGQ